MSDARPIRVLAVDDHQLFRQGIGALIEDEPDILEMMRYNLDREGFRVSTVINGEDGYERAQKDAPDLVLLDLMMPGLDGLEVCRRLKADPVTRGIRIVMVTAKGDESDIVLGLGLGADDYVPKPFSPKELVARVKAVLRRAPLRDETASRERMVFGNAPPARAPAPAQP